MLEKIYTKNARPATKKPLDQTRIWVKKYGKKQKQKIKQQHKQLKKQIGLRKLKGLPICLFKDCSDAKLFHGHMVCGTNEPCNQKSKTFITKLVSLN